MTNFTFKGTEVKLNSFTNAQGKERITVEYSAKRIYSFFKEDSIEADSFIEDVVFELKDSANRNSPFNLKNDCIEFANLLIENIK